MFEWSLTALSRIILIVFVCPETPLVLLASFFVDLRIVSHVTSNIRSTILTCLISLGVNLNLNVKR